ncbi:MAG: site-specific DNA-methyltransferase [Planctomycetes bacterium]|nr:site-specific DNA-methyltransferase [Planctomycetota bacterium]
MAEPLRGLAVPVADLHLDPANARRHGDRNVEAIAASLSRWGQRAPLVVQRDGMVVRAGNGRLEAAKRLGWTHVAALIVDEENVDATAFAIADNRTAELAEWDDEALAALLESMDGDVLAATGFAQGELDALIAGLSHAELVEPALPEVPEEPVTRPGDLWALGGHRLLCGDATKPEDVGRLLDGREPFIMVTDPPYGVEYEPKWRLDAGLNKPWQTRAEGRVSNDGTADWTPAYRLFPGRVAYVWHAGRFAGGVADNIHAAGFEVRSQIIWAKPSLVISRGHYHWQHEPCWYAVRKGGSAKWCGGRKQSTVWDIANMHRTQGSVDDGKTMHGTQKPVECMARPIRNHGGKGDDVYDPFLGSGTTLIAAERLGRSCFGIEISPGYCDVICQRWSNLTGKDALRVDSE